MSSSLTKNSRLIGRVTTMVLAERAGLAGKLSSASDVPASVDRLSLDWLTAVLCRNAPGARVEAMEVGRGTDGTSSRRALRVTYNSEGVSAGLPENLFSKSTATIGSRLLLGLTDIAVGESLFCNNARGALDIRSPRSFYSGFDSRTGRSMVLLEDLGVEGWTFPDPQTNVVTRSDADDIVAELANYHAHFWDSPRFRDDLAALKGAYHWQSDLNAAVPFKKRVVRGIERAADIVPPELLRREAEVFPALMRSLELHAVSAPTLLHQDLHLGNWLRDPGGRMGLYDWQCVATGNWASDFSYALAGTLATEDRRRWEKDLLRFYVEELSRRGVPDPPSFDQSWLSYRQQAFHGLVFGLFTLGGSRFEPELQPRDYTLSAISRIAQHAVDLESLDSF